MRSKNTPFQITVPDYRDPISGVVNTAMPAGSLVQLKAGAATDARELVAANGTGKVAILEVEVMTDVDWQAHCKLNPQFNPEIRMPVPVGSTVTARFAKEAEFEGTGYFTAGSIDAASTAGAALKIAAGKFSARTAIGERLVGHLGRLIPPHDPASFRWTVDFL